MSDPTPTTPDDEHPDGADHVTGDATTDEQADGGTGADGDDDTSDDGSASSGDETDDGAAGPRRDEDGASSRTPARGMLVERAAAMGVEPTPPPRRTGVFVDVDEVRTYVGQLLRTMLGGYEVDALGNLTFTSEGARIFITVGPGPMGPHVGVFSILTVDQPLSPELSAFLLTTNHRMAFGAFSYEREQRAVWLRHSLLGATLDGPELRSAVISVATTAGTVSETLRERFGGGSFADAPAERQAEVHPPEPQDDDATNVSGYL